MNSHTFDGMPVLMNTSFIHLTHLKTLLRLSGLLLLTLASCSKNDHTARPNQTADEGSGPKTLVTDRMITSVTPNSIQFDTSMFDLEIGDIIVSGVSAHAPNGFLRKVSSVEIVNGQTVIETTNATLREALAHTMKDGEVLGEDFAFTFDDSESTHERNVPQPALNLAFRRNLMIHLKDADSLGSTVEIQGTLTATPGAGGEIYFSLQKSPEGLLKPRLDSLSYYLKTSNALYIYVRSQITHPYQKEWVVDSFASPTATTIWLGAIPVVLKCSITISLGIQADFHPNVYYDYGDNSMIDEGIAYNSTDRWFFPKTNEFRLIHDTAGVFSASNEGTGKTYLKTEASVTLYDAEIPMARISASPYAEERVTTRVNPDLTVVSAAIKGGLNTGAFFSALPFLGDPMADTSWDHIINVPGWPVINGWAGVNP